MAQRVLIVEPVRAVAKALAAVLERSDDVVTVAASAEEANRHSGPFDCGVFNTTLPDGSGIALAGWLLAESRVRAVVFYGDDTDTDVRLRASNLGSFVQRSEGIHHLSCVIRDAIEDTAARRRVAGGEDTTTGRVELKSGARRKR